MLVIGVLGGVASGKSLVCQMLERLGAVRVDADQIGHEVLEEPAVKTEIRRRWGDKVFLSDGRVNRGAVARIVFGATPESCCELRFLEQLTHPRIGQRLHQILDAFRATPTLKAVVLDAPVLLKAGWQKFCDRIVFVEAPWELRVQRARDRGWTEQDLAAREAAQESNETKRNQSNWIFDNSGTPDQTFEKVQQFWRTLD